MRGKKRVEPIFLAAVLATVVAGWFISGITFERGMQDWRDGDLILQHTTADHGLPVFEEEGAGEPNLAIVRVTPDGPVVIEARETVSEVTLKAFLQAGLTPDYTVYRLAGLEPEQAAAVVKAASALKGRSADFFLERAPDQLYASEFVQLAFRNAGIELGRTQRLRDLARGKPRVEAAFGARWNTHRPCKARYLSQDECWRLVGRHEVIAPRVILADSRISRVFTTLPEAPQDPGAPAPAEPPSAQTAVQSAPQPLPPPMLRP